MFSSTGAAKLDCDSERIWKIIDKYTPKDKSQKRPDSEDIYDNLYNCYINHLNGSSDKRFRSSTNLLQKLPPAVAQVSVIINLYSDEKGYSIMLPEPTSHHSSENKEIFLPYENDDLFSYLDSGEVPPVLMEILGKTKYCQMYSGCIICEVRSYRVPYLLPAGEDTLNYESQLILLKPSPEITSMLINDFSRNCTKEDRLTLESRVLMATQPPLCLDPDTDVVCVQNRMHYNRKKYHTSGIRRYLRRQCQARRSIMQLYAEGPNPETLLLESFLSSKKIPRSHTARIKSLKERRKHIEKPCNFDEIMSEVKKYARPVHGVIAPVEIINRQEQQSSSKPLPGPPPRPTVTTTSDSISINLKGREDKISVKTEEQPSKPPLDVPIPSSHQTIPPHPLPPNPATIKKPHKPVVAAPPQQPRPISRPVFARPVLPGITVLMGDSKAGRSVLPKAPPKLRPSLPPSIQPSKPVSSTVPPTLKLLKQALPLPAPPPSTSLPPPLKQQPIKATPPTSIAPAMPQLHKLKMPFIPGAGGGGGGGGGGPKQKKRKQK